MPTWLEFRRVNGWTSRAMGSVAPEVVSARLTIRISATVTVAG